MMGWQCWLHSLLLAATPSKGYMHWLLLWLCRPLMMSLCGASCCGATFDHSDPDVAQQAAAALAE
jgi:hypothetical protein